MKNLKENNKRLIYGRDRPLDVEIGLFRELSKVYSEILIFTSTDYEKNRKNNNGGFNFPKNLKTILIDDISKIHYERYLSDDNLFHGITGINHKHLRKFLSIDKNFKFSICAERPNIYGRFLKKSWMEITRGIYYKYYLNKYKDNILTFFAMGTKGVNSYSRYGVDNNKLFPIMYTLDLHDGYSVPQDLCSKGHVSFIYFGRFDDETKGIDLLRRAGSSLTQFQNHHLFLAGGYGKDAKKTLEGVNRNENVHYLGAWNQDDIYKNLSSYDVCVAPSRYDGWNLTPNHAIDAGNAVIISDNATSNDLVTYSKCGIVYSSNSLAQLKESILYAANHPATIKEGKMNAVNYKPFINNLKICKYFISALEFSKSGYNTNKPIAPGIK